MCLLHIYAIDFIVNYFQLFHIIKYFPGLVKAGHMYRNIHGVAYSWGGGVYIIQSHIKRETTTKLKTIIQL